MDGKKRTLKSFGKGDTAGSASEKVILSEPVVLAVTSAVAQLLATFPSFRRCGISLFIHFHAFCGGGGSFSALKASM